MGTNKISWQSNIAAVEHDVVSFAEDEQNQNRKIIERSRIYLKEPSNAHRNTQFPKIYLFNFCIRRISKSGSGTKRKFWNNIMENEIYITIIVAIVRCTVVHFNG